MHKKNRLFLASAVIAIIGGIGLISHYLTKEEAVIHKPVFSEFEDISMKKNAFFDYLRPTIEQENKRILEERARLLEIKRAFESGKVSNKDKKYAAQLGERYNATLDPDNSSEIDEKWLSEMLLKVNVLPEALVLIQAANESAWGTSRFATEANNYFGQWCYAKGCGLVPSQRNEEATHEVAKFDSVSDSVHGYFMNVNRNNAYSKLRSIRATLDSEGKELLDVDAALALTNGLLSYSERGQAYIDDIQAMIKSNKKFLETED